MQHNQKLRCLKLQSFSFMFQRKARAIFLIFYFMTVFFIHVSTSNPVDITIRREYHGEYISKQSGKTFGYLEERSGEILAVFYGSPNRGVVNSVEIVLLDPQYQDLRSVLIDIKGIVDVNSSTGIWLNNSHLITYTKKWKQRNVDIIQQELVNTVIIFENLDSQDYQEVSITIKMKGKQFQFTAELKFYNQIISTMFYNIFASGVLAIQIYCAYMIVKIMQAPNFVFSAKFSVLTLSLCNIEDFAKSMNHIQYIMSQSSGYLFFISTSLAYIVLFVFFEMKMLFLVWKSHNLANLDNPQILRKKLTIFYCHFYIGLFAYLTLNYFFAYEDWMIILRNFLLLPQIIHNVRLGQKPLFNPYYIFGFIGCRLLIPFYQRTCPENRFKIAPNITLVFILLTIYIFKVILLALQNRLGSRFFVPKRFLPNYFQYRQKIKISENNNGDDCAICLQNLFEKQTTTTQLEKVNQENLNLQVLQEEFLQEITIMKTPCNHKFHEECLTQWLNVKLQCPTCRTVVPPLQ